MGFWQTKDVAVLLMEDLIEPGVAHVANSHGWPVFRITTHQQAFRSFYPYQPRILILQTHDVNQHAMDLIHATHSHWRRMDLIVVIRHHHTPAECAARSAGAACYFPCPVRESDVTAAVHGLLNANHQEIP